MKNRWGLRLIGLLAVSCVAMSGVSLAVEPGSATDPLITLSYLNETFMGQIMDRVDQKIAQRNSGLGQSGAGMEFSVVTLSKGQVLTGDIGCEVMLRVGSATCVAASTPGLVDETSGSTLSGGGSAGGKPSVHDDCGEPGRQGRGRHGEAAGAGNIYHRLTRYIQDRLRVESRRRSFACGGGELWTSIRFWREGRP